MIPIQLKVVNPQLHQWGLPHYATKHSAGVDLRACIREPLDIAPGQTNVVGSGVAVHLQDKTVGLLAPRSGLATKHNIILANVLGIIDFDYQGEIKIALHNRSRYNTYTVSPGERVAQLLILPVFQAQFIEVQEFEQPTQRGDGGFGHTGRF